MSFDSGEDHWIEIALVDSPPTGIFFLLHSLIPKVP